MCRRHIRLFVPVGTKVQSQLCERCFKSSADIAERVLDQHRAVRVDRRQERSFFFRRSAPIDGNVLAIVTTREHDETLVTLLALVRHGILLDVPRHAVDFHVRRLDGEAEGVTAVVTKDATNTDDQVARRIAHLGETRERPCIPFEVHAVAIDHADLRVEDLEALCVDRMTKDLVEESDATLRLERTQGSVRVAADDIFRIPRVGAEHDLRTFRACEDFFPQLGRELGEYAIDVEGIRNDRHDTRRIEPKHIPERPNFIAASEAAHDRVFGRRHGRHDKLARLCVIELPSKRERWHRITPRERKQVSDAGERGPFFAAVPAIAEVVDGELLEEVHFAVDSAGEFRIDHLAIGEGVRRNRRRVPDLEDQTLDEADAPVEVRMGIRDRHEDIARLHDCALWHRLDLERPIAELAERADLPGDFRRIRRTEDGRPILQEFVPHLLREPEREVLREIVLESEEHRLRKVLVAPCDQVRVHFVAPRNILFHVPHLVDVEREERVTLRRQEPCSSRCEQCTKRNDLGIQRFG